MKDEIESIGDGLYRYIRPDSWGLSTEENTFGCVCESIGGGLDTFIGNREQVKALQKHSRASGKQGG